MKNIKIISNSVYVILLILSISCTHKDKLDYKNPNLPIEKRIDDLLSRMTVEEKARQLDMYIPIDIVTEKEFDEAKLDSVVGDMGVGSIHDLYPLHAKLPNDIQQYLVEKTRLGIPALLTAEALHGYSGSKGTCFPAPIGMGSMWDTILMRKIGRVIGTEARSHGIHFVLSPVLGLAREPRWGRVEETYGEDPYHVAQTGKAIIMGMQGESFKDNNSVISEPKHYAIHSIPESGTNNSPVQMGEREARETFLYPWEVAIKEAKAHGVMAAYHDWDGIPVVASPFLLKELLRDEWGFKGMVLSDLGAIKRQNIHHFTAKTPEEAITKSIKSGLDMQFMDFSHEVFQQSIIDAVEKESLTMDELDRAVSAVLDVWYAGDEGGNAIADVLFGDYNPAGRLPITFPIHEAQLPLYYNHKSTGRIDDYMNLTGKPLFPFGYGLSYTNFQYSELIIDALEITKEATTTVRFKVKNTGAYDGDEVIQLYIKDLFASVARPIIELKGFQRIFLKKGETKEMEFKITPELLTMLDENMNRVVEPGEFRILIGASSNDIRLRAILNVIE